MVNLSKLNSFLNRNVFLFNDKYRGTSSGLSGRFDRWIDIFDKIGPIGIGYGSNVLGEKLIAIDNQWLYSSYIAGNIFTAPLFVFVLYFVSNAFINIFKEKIIHYFSLKMR